MINDDAAIYENTTGDTTRDENTRDEEISYNDTNIIEIENINPDYNFPVFNLINSLHRTSNLNNCNYYISMNEEDEIQEAIRLSLEN